MSIVFKKYLILTVSKWNICVCVGGGNTILIQRSNPDSLSYESALK